MITTSLLGALGTLIGLVRAVPQLARLLRARHAHGVSVDSAATSSIVSFGWATYGLLTGQLYVSLATGASGIIFALVTAFAVRYGHRLREARIAPIWLAVLILSLLAGGTTGLGFALPISVLAANVPQLWVAYHEGNLVDLSLGTWLLSTADGLVWGLYALLQQDRSILVFGGFQIVTSGLIVALKLAHMARRARQSAGA